MSLFLAALLIFFMRVTDQTLGTLRIVMLVRGRRLLAGALGFFESLVWVLAAGQVLTNLDSPLKIIAFAGGFSAGTMLGGTVERWLALGDSLLQIVAPVESPPAAHALREAGFGATVVNAEGMDGAVRITFTVIPRKRAREVMRIVKSVNPAAYVTFEEISTPNLQLIKEQRRLIRK
jgi:uncharacterized protein YebE (UPF0316 family)